MKVIIFSAMWLFLFSIGKCHVLRAKNKNRGFYDKRKEKRPSQAFAESQLTFSISRPQSMTCQPSVKRTRGL